MKIRIKIFILISLIFLMTGCNITYNVNISDSTVKETIIATETNKKLFNTMIEETTGPDAPITPNNGISYLKEIQLSYNYDHLYFSGVSESDEVYNIKDQSTNDKKEAKFEAQMSLSDYKNVSSVKYCYDNFNVVESSDNDDEVILSTSDEFKCIKKNIFNQATINITTDYDVLDHNADSVNNGTYTWLINNDNRNNKSIYLSIKKKTITSKDEKTTKKETNTKKDNHTLLYIGIILTIIVLVILLTALFISKRSKQANKI